MMDFLVIDRARLLYEYNYQIKRQQKGILNWFINEDRILTIILDIDNVRYVYQDSVDKEDEIVRTMLSKRNMILGIVDEEEIMPEKVELKPLGYDELKIGDY